MPLFLWPENTWRRSRVLVSFQRWRTENLGCQRSVTERKRGRRKAVLDKDEFGGRLGGERGQLSEEEGVLTVEYQKDKGKSCP